MRKEEFMRRLELLLSDVSEEERREALSYYRNYFEDAGEENEERILTELESPEKVAATIKADLGVDQAGNTGTYTERGFEDERFEREKQTIDIKKKTDQNQDRSQAAYDQNRTLKILLIVIIAILTSPIWGGIVAGIGGAILGLAIGAVASAGALYICGAVLLGVGIGQFVVGNIAVGFALAGAGMLVWALAVLITVVCVWFCGKVIPWFCDVIGRLWRSVFSGRERTV